MDFGAAFSLATLVASAPGFSLLQTIRDVQAIQALVAAIKTAGKFDPAALDKLGLLAPAVDAAVRLVPLVELLRKNQAAWANVLALLKSVA